MGIDNGSAWMHRRRRVSGWGSNEIGGETSGVVWPSERPWSLGGRKMGGRRSDKTVATLSRHCVLLGIVIAGRAVARNPAHPPAGVLQVLRAPIRHATLGHVRVVHLVLGDAHGDLGSRYPCRPGARQNPAPLVGTLFNSRKRARSRHPHTRGLSDPVRQRGSRTAGYRPSLQKHLPSSDLPRGRHSGGALRTARAQMAQMVAHCCLQLTRLEDQCRVHDRG